MSNFLLELISEEIPAFLQEPAAEKLAQSLETEFSDINLKANKVFAGVRRIAVLATVDSKTKAQTIEERGPKTTAPPQAKEKFSEKHNVSPSALTEKDGYWYLEKHLPETLASDVLSERLPTLIWNFKWSKMLRWGKSQFQWIRPLRQIVCLLDDKVVPFSLARGDDNGNNIKSGSISSGLHPRNNSSIEISSAASWESDLRKAGVIAFRPDRLEQIEKQTQDVLKQHNLEVNLSEFGAAKLNNELAGLTENPTIYLGTINKSFMELPTEVRDISMRAHQRYIPLSDTNGESAPFFLFAANGSFPENGKSVIAGNESVLTARLEDARHFWNTDRKIKLEDRLDHLSNMSFHTSLGSQKDRARRLEKLSGSIATLFGLSAEEIKQSSRAGLLSKADLQSQMVGEFPELQGIMGSYYAVNDHEDKAVSDALRSQYSGTPPADCSSSNVQAAVSIADRLDTLVGFFGKDMKPSGSKDPYALRRKGNELLAWASTLENKTKTSINLLEMITRSVELFHEHGIKINVDETQKALNLFFNERLSQFLPTSRKDLTVAISPKGNSFAGDEELLFAQASKVEVLEKFLNTADGEKLMQSYKRLSNILENDKENVPANIHIDLLEDHSEKALNEALTKAFKNVSSTNFEGKLRELNNLGGPLDNFFEKVMVFDENEKVRHNRVSLLKVAQETILSIVDLSKIQQS